jgi:hypothetical protein
MAEAFPGATRQAKTRALVSPVLELASFGAMYVILGLAFAGVAIAVDDAASAVVEILSGAVVFCAGMYRVVYREYARRSVVEELGAPPTAALESNIRTFVRGALLTAPLAILLVAFTLWDSNALPVGAGIAIGNGIGLLLTSRWFRRWEEEHQSELRREPRWRWSSGRHRRGWGRGRGMFEPKDFYALSSNTSGA